MSYDYHADGTVTVPSWEQQNYSEYCFNRLPCGYCRLLYQPCPMIGNRMEITWTCQKDGDGDV
jgi:hypothetical protein